MEIRARCGGWALILKGQLGTYASYSATIHAREPRVEFTPFKNGRGMFTPQRVWIEGPSGVILRARDHPRRYLPSLRRHLWWDALDVLYFGGYAMWNYLLTPHLLAWPGVAIQEIEPWNDRGETWRRLAVTFPASIPTHSREQVFYIDARSRIRRHDYTAEPISTLAKAAHYCDDHRDFSGLLFPTRRRVYPRRPDNRSLGSPTLIWIDIDAVQPVWHS